MRVTSFFCNGPGQSLSTKIVAGKQDRLQSNGESLPKPQPGPAATEPAFGLSAGTGGHLPWATEAGGRAMTRLWVARPSNLLKASNRMTAKGPPPSPLHCKGATSCFLDKLPEGTCCKAPDVNELENPQITQLFADSRRRRDGDGREEGGPPRSVASSSGSLPFSLKICANR